MRSSGVKYLIVMFFITSGMPTKYTFGQTIPDVERILQYHISTCGPNSLCDQDILLRGNHTYSYRNNKYCSPCRPCFCDELCVFLADCCLDLQLNMTNHFVGSTKIREEDIVCKSEVNIKRRRRSLLLTRNVDKYPVLIKCPNDTTDMDVIRKCENPDLTNLLSVVPVTSTETGLTYSNMGCFTCHGAKYPVMWNMRLQCRKQRRPTELAIVSSAEEILQMADEKNCKLIYEPNTDADVLRTCYNPPKRMQTCRETDSRIDPNIVWGCENVKFKIDQYANMFCSLYSDVVRRPIYHACNKTGKWQNFDNSLNERCINGSIALMPSGIKLYRNVDCYLCNLQHNTGKQCHVMANHRASIGMLFDMAYLLGSIHIGEVKSDQKCSRRKVFDAYQGKCRHIFCPLGSVFKEDKCESLMKNTLSSYVYNLFFRLHPFDTLPSASACDLLEWVKMAVEKELTRELNFDKSIGIQFKNFGISTRLEANKSDEADTTSDTLTHTDERHNSNDDIMVSLDIILNNVEFRSHAEKILLKARSFTYLIDNWGNRTYNLKAFIDEMAYATVKINSVHRAACVKNNTKLTSKELMLPVLPVNDVLMCQQIELEQGEYKILNDYSIYVPVLRDTLSISQYVLIENRVRVCLEVYIRTSLTRVNPSSLVNVLLTRTSSVCSYISLFFLFVTFVTYCIFPKYRTLPGKLIICLTVELFVAILSIELSLHNLEKPAMCFALGILAHYCWLGFFISLNSCCIQMYRVFCTCGITRNTPEEENRRLKKFLLYIVGVPAVVVAVTIAINILVLGSFNYKSNGITCFIIDPISRVVAFILPVSLLTVWNVVMFLCIVHKVYSNPRLPVDSGYQHHMRSFAKLSTLTGIMWMMQLLEASLEYTEVSYSILSVIITIMNSSHGAFIFLAFICNSRVHHSYKDLFLFCKKTHFRRKNIGETESRTPA